MKIVDKFLQKVGADKVLHFTIAALITAWGGYFGDSGLFIATFGTVALSYLKEELDEEFCTEDIFYSLGGVVTSIVVYLCGLYI
jgi:hypothetical protein